jgi:hypothetical protein
MEKEIVSIDIERILNELGIKFDKDNLINMIIQKAHHNR